MNNRKGISCALAVTLVRVVLSIPAILGIFTRLLHVNGVMSLLSFAASSLLLLAPLLLLVPLVRSGPKSTELAVRCCQLVCVCAFVQGILLFCWQNPAFFCFLVCGLVYLRMAGDLRNHRTGMRRGALLWFNLCLLGTCVFVIFLSRVDAILSSASALWLLAIASFLPPVFTDPENAPCIPGPKTIQTVAVVAVLLIFTNVLPSGVGAPVSNTSSSGSDSSGSSYYSSSSGSSGGSHYSSGSSSGSSSDYSFEDYLRDNDPESYAFYKDLEEGWNSGTWDPENGFAGG